MCSLALMGIITTTASLFLLLSAAMTLKLVVGVRKRWLLPLVGLAVFAASGGMYALGQQIREIGCNETRAAMRLGEARILVIQPASTPCKPECRHAEEAPEEKVAPIATEPLTRGTLAG
jgi:hypothetical protein